jgi:hypothetical protein
MTQLIRDFLKLGSPVTDTFLTWCGYTHRSMQAPLRRNERCRLAHLAWDRGALPRTLPSCTLEDLLIAANVRGAALPPESTLTIEGYHFVECAYCGCGRPQPLGRFVTEGTGAGGNCGACKQPLVVPAYHQLRAVPLEYLPRRVALAALGATGASAAWIDDGAHVVFVRHLPACGTTRAGDPDILFPPLEGRDS